MFGTHQFKISTEPLRMFRKNMTGNDRFPDFLCTFLLCVNIQSFISKQIIHYHLSMEISNITLRLERKLQENLLYWGFTRTSLVFVRNLKTRVLFSCTINPHIVRISSLLFLGLTKVKFWFSPSLCTLFKTKRTLGKLRSF